MRIASIASGSSGNCIYIGSDKTHVLIDAGISKKRIEEGLNQHDIKLSEVNGIFITHEHVDHIQGLGVVLRKYPIPVYGTKETLDAVLKYKNIGKVDESLFQPIVPDEDFVCNDLTIHPFSISHDAANPVAYRVEREHKSIAVATDMGTYTDYTVDNIKGVDALLLEANHDIRMLQAGSYPYHLKQRILGNRGHLSNESSGQLLCRILHDNLKHIFLGHLSHENNMEELAYETVRLEITMGDNPYKAEDFSLQVAKRNCPSALVEI